MHHDDEPSEDESSEDGLSQDEGYRDNDVYRDNPQPMRINRVKVTNQGILRDVSASFGLLNELYGAISSGKTTMMRTLKDASDNIIFGRNSRRDSRDVCRRIYTQVPENLAGTGNVSVRVNTSYGDLVASRSAEDWQVPEDLSWSGKRVYHQLDVWYIDFTAKDFLNSRDSHYRGTPTYPEYDRESYSYFGWGNVPKYKDNLSNLLEEVFGFGIRIHDTGDAYNALKFQLQGESQTRYVSEIRFGILRVAGTLSYLIDTTHYRAPQIVFVDHANVGLSDDEFLRYANVLSREAVKYYPTAQVFVAHGLNLPVIEGSNRLRFDVSNHHTWISEGCYERGADEDTLLSDLRQWPAPEDELPRS